jgi:hypothetical protein
MQLLPKENIQIYISWVVKETTVACTYWHMVFRQLLRNNLKSSSYILAMSTPRGKKINKKKWLFFYCRFKVIAV